MNNQVKLIDGNKIKEWLEERANVISQEQAKTQDADRFQFLNGEYYFIKELLVLINYDKFTIYTPPVPTIKPGDKEMAAFEQIKERIEEALNDGDEMGWRYALNDINNIVLGWEDEG